MIKSVLITGTGGGLGKELVSVFSICGWNVMEHKGRVQGNLNNPETIERLRYFAEAYDIDLLINNAGVYTNKTLPEMSIGKYWEVMETNLLAPIALTKAIWPIFQKKKKGMVIFINSMAGIVGSQGESAYCASKFGLKGFADSLQFEGVKENIRVLSFYFGAMKTGMRWGSPDYEKFIDPAEAAKTVLEFCQSKPSSRITSIEIKRNLY